MTKTCSLCKTEKHIDQFALRNREQGTYQSWCKPCKQAYESDYYRKSSSRKEQIKQQNAVAIERTKAYILTRKEGGCVDCGELDPIVLDFDHIGDDKTYDIGNMRGWGIEKIKKEIDKCEVVCSNCHRRRTHTRRLSS